MSNAIRYDSLLAHYLAGELHDRFAGRQPTALRMDPDRRQAALVFPEEALLLDLHPTRGTVRLAAPPALPVSAPLPKRASVERVVAPPDERLLVFELAGGSRPVPHARRIVVELMTNQWNLVAVDGQGRIASVLWRRAAGERVLRPGHLYEAPPPAGRQGVEAPLAPEAWRRLLAEVDPGERERRLTAEVAWTSPLNAASMLGAASATVDGAALEAAYARYRAIATLPPAAPQVLERATTLQPYPLPLPGEPSRPMPSLLDAMAAAAGAGAPEARPAAPAAPAELLERLRRRIAHLESRGGRLAGQLAGAAAEAEASRRQADLLLSQLHRVRKGMDRVELSDFAGGTLEVALDPALGPVENATGLYERAKKRERAAARLPALIERTAAERDRLAGVLERAERGEAEPAELEREAGPAEAPGGRRREEAPLLPYRAYRTSGGLEVRVGRSSRANDELTFRHSAPSDIWLHARDVAGAHVILRWGDATANPPGRDLEEAAVLAALHSRARTSGTVPVDWTRRKYVRKPRKAPPGLVTMERARTLFVEPDEALARRLAGEEG